MTLGRSLLFLLLIISVYVSTTFAKCGQWKTGTMSGYDNLDGSDDMHPGSLAEWSGTNEQNLKKIPVASINMPDWNRYKYHNIEVKYNGQTRTVQSWDQCADEDCPDRTPCCTNNAKKFANPGFLIDIDKRTLKRLFGIRNYENTLARVEYRICDRFNPRPIAQANGLHQ